MIAVDFGAGFIVTFTLFHQWHNSAQRFQRNLDELVKADVFQQRIQDFRLQAAFQTTCNLFIGLKQGKCRADFILQFGRKAQRRFLVFQTLFFQCATDGVVSLHFHQCCGFGIVFAVTQTFEECRIVQAQQFAGLGIGQLGLFVWFVHKCSTFGISQRTFASLI